jgi:beta-lactamase regulating signal transducer with metallopeptidase domain
MNRTILTFGGVLSASSLLMMDSAIKGTVLLVLAAVAALLLRRDSAATRHLVWMMAIIALLMVPVLSAALPQWRVLPNWMSAPRPFVAAIESVSPSPIPKSNGGVFEIPERATSTTPVGVDQTTAPALQPATSVPVSQPTRIASKEIPTPIVRNWSWMKVIPLVWAIGFVILMLRLSAARWMLWKSERLAIVIGRQVAPQLAIVSRSDLATSQDPIVIAMAALCSRLKIRRPVTLLIHPHKTIPVVWGIVRCRLMLPAAARQWSDERLQSVLIHELAHIKRGDTLVQLLTQVACALHWFNPLVWFAAWRLDVERERSCDDLVLASGIRPSAYAAHLLDVVSGLSPARWTQVCGLAMARKSSLEGRLTAVLGKDLNRRGVSLTLAGVGLFIAIGIAVPIAMLRAAQQVEDKSDLPNSDKEMKPENNANGDLQSNPTAKSGDPRRTQTFSVTEETDKKLQTGDQELPLSKGEELELFASRLRSIAPREWVVERKDRAFRLRGPDVPAGKERAQILLWFDDVWVDSNALAKRNKSLPKISPMNNTRIGRHYFTRNTAAVELWPEFGQKVRLIEPVDQIAIASTDVLQSEVVSLNWFDAAFVRYVEIGPDGRRQSQLMNLDGSPIGITAATKFLVVGKLPNPQSATNEADRDSALRHLKTFDELQAEANRHGVRTISLADFERYTESAVKEGRGFRTRQLDDANKLQIPECLTTGQGLVVVRPVPLQVQEAETPMNVSAGKLAPETIAKLKWGEPVNGLRMALAWPPMFDDAALGKKPHFELVVQNVSEKEIHFLASDEAPNPRELNFRADNRTVLVLADEETAKADWNLQAGHCGVLRMFTKEGRDDNGKTVSAGIEGDLSKIDGNLAVAEMEITNAPEGAWTGKLVSGPTRGSADVAAAPAPMHKDARTLYEVWQRYARSNGDIPGALIGELAKAVKTFIGYNPTWETVPKLNEILPRLDATRDWKPADAIALLDEVAGIQDSPLSPEPWKGTRDTIRQGDALPKKYADVTWGEEQPSGLRAAWVLEPSAAEHRIGTALKARLLVQNRGQVPIMQQVPTWHQGWVNGTDAKGAEVQVTGIEWTTMSLLHTVRLDPGEYIEINAPGVGIGSRAGMGPWAGPRVGSNVLAKAGDELTLTHGLVPLDGSEVGLSEDDPHVSGPGWWLAHIKARLNRELPLPADAAERTRMLDRAVRELFATAPTAEETEAFIADKTPDAIDALAKRLAARTDVVSFSGKLPTAPVKFRVLDADANSDKQPRVVLGPGEYPLPSASAERGDATLKIVGRPVGDRRTNDAQLIFEATEFTGALPPDPHKLEVPDGWGTWAIVCRPSDGFFYLLHKGTVRKIDFTKPRKVTDTPANDLPAEFRDEVKRQLDIHEISAEQQAEIFEKAVPPAASLRSEVLEALKPGAMLQPATEQKLKWGEPVNGLRMALAWPPSLGEPGLGDVPEFYLVVQNVSDKGVRLTANDAAPNPRGLNLYDATIVSRTVDDLPIPGDWLLQPREATFVRLFHAEQKFEDGRTSSVLKENVVSTLGQYSYTAEMTIATAPAGAWTGKLVTGATRGSADVLEAGKPIELRSAPPMSWGMPKDGLRGACRIIGEMPTGGQAKAELWVWNASVDVVKLSWTERADIGLAVMIADGTNPAREAPVTRDKKDFQLHYLVLPAGQAVKLKEFAVRLGSPPNDAPVGTVSLPLTPGEWTLQAKWSDSRHIVDAAPEWHGVLDTGELKLKVTPEGATVAEAAAVKAKWPPVRQKTEWSEEFLAHSKAVAEARGTPEAIPEDLIAWGLEENGLRAGLLMAPQVTLGGQLPTRMVLRNVSNDVRELGLSLSLNRLTATAQTPDGKSLQVHKTQLRGGDALYKVTLFPGEQVEFEGPPVQFGVEHDGETKKVKTPKFPICGVETGVAKVHVRFTVQASTGVAVVEVAAAKAGAANPQPKGAINAEAALVRLEGKGKDADGKTVVLMRFEELQRDAATSTVRVTSIGGGGGSVGSPMFIVRGACEIAKARGAAYFANLKEWDAEDGTGMYLIGFSKTQDIRPLTSDRQLQIFAVGHFEFLFKDPAAADADKPQEKLAELDAKIAALKMERVKLSESLAPTHPNIRKLDAEVEALEKARTAFVATNPQANAGANIVKVPDDQYVKSGFPVDELAGEGVTVERRAKRFVAGIPHHRR